MIELRNFHPSSLCDEPGFWWLGLLLYHRLLWLCCRESYLLVCVV